MFQTIIASMLEEKIGLSAEAVGADTIAKAVRRRMTECGLSAGDESEGFSLYLSRLRSSEEEWEKLVEAVVVPETWFFRNQASFSFLKGYVRFEWLPEHKGQVLRVLSIPCSTGEEPYSAAMTFADMGVPEEIAKGRFHIEAADISEKAIQKARIGIYGLSSFRGEDLYFRDRYFERLANTDTYKIHTYIKNMVRFTKGNLLDSRILAGEKPYDIIFCRNLLIYFTGTAKEQVVSAIDRLLARDGILFVGHVERPLISNSIASLRFVWIRQSGVFACRRAGQTHQRQSDSPRGSGPGLRLSSPEKMPLSHETQCLESTETHGRASLLSAETQRKKPESGITSDLTVSSLDSMLDEAQRLADRGALNESLELCQRCLNEDPFHSRTHFLAGVIYNAINDEVRAEEYFNKTVYLDPNHYEALSHLALILEHRGLFHGAARLRQRAQRILQREGT
jgi:chemotaxis protein methyltransferase WspC